MKLVDYCIRLRNSKISEISVFLTMLTRYRPHTTVLQRQTTLLLDMDNNFKFQGTIALKFCKTPAGY
jgi:hypothetical protein